MAIASVSVILVEHDSTGNTYSHILNQGLVNNESDGFETLTYNLSEYTGTDRQFEIQFRYLLDGGAETVDLRVADFQVRTN